MVQGPEDFHPSEKHPLFCVFIELSATFTLVLAVMVMPYYSKWMGRAFIAIVVRLLTTYAGPYGFFNPLVLFDSLFIVYLDQF